MDLEKLKQIIQKKPLFFLGATLIYIILVTLLRWRFQIPLDALFFAIGGVIGVYILDIAEAFFAITPSPFRSIIFEVSFAILSIFIVTSTSASMAAGLVLSMYLGLIFWQVGQWQIAGNLNDWYRMVSEPVAVNVQWWILLGFIGLFGVVTFIFAL